MLKRIDDLISVKVEEALANAGIIEPERMLYEIGIMSAPRFMNPHNPQQDEMLYSALVFLAYPVPDRPFDRIEHHFQLKEPYGPQVMYDLAVKEIVAKISTELETAARMGPGHDKVSAAGLYIS